MLFAAGRFAAAGGLMILAGLCDLLDGPVARRQNRVSLFGGFLDSILDRYADLILFLGLLVYYAQVNRFRYAVLAGAAMAGSVMVSYAKARAESLVPTSEIGFWERPERLVLMILGALTNRIDVALWLLAIGPNITVIHRILHTWKQTRGNRLEAVQMPAQNSSAPKTRDASPILTHSAGRGRI
jgi:CDP-diacylglycerol--glycerol-3-phosphate 3-phosphatidyltransferase